MSSTPHLSTFVVRRLNADYAHGIVLGWWSSMAASGNERAKNLEVSSVVPAVYFHDSGQCVEGRSLATDYHGGAS